MEVHTGTGTEKPQEAQDPGPEGPQEASRTAENGRQGVTRKMWDSLFLFWKKYVILDT